MTFGPPPLPNALRRTLLHYVWPPNEPWLRARVVVSFACLIGAKLVGIQVPFIFKHLADALAVTTEVGASVAAGGAVVAVPEIAVSGTCALPRALYTASLAAKRTAKWGQGFFLLRQ